MFTLNQIHLWLEKLHRESKKNKNYTTLIKFYSDLEKELPISRCKIKDNNFDAETFKELQNDDFTNPYINWIGECFIDSLGQGKDKFFINQKIKNHLTNLKKIGVDGAHGFAFISDFQAKRKKTKDLFVIKSAISDHLRFDELRHEVIIGLELNNLRSKIPNFAYVYGGFTCGMPMIINRKAENWCSTNNNVSYIVYEYINNSIRFQDYTDTCTTEQFIEKYLQILLAINYAYKQIDFTHYDLHNDNVLLRDVEGHNKLAIKYTFPKNRTRYILTDKVMTIIDYGFAHLKKDNKTDVGNPMFMAFGVFPNQSHIYGDAYKLLAFSMNSMRYDNFPVYRSLFPLIRFFDDRDNVDDIIGRGRMDLYVCPKTTNNGLDDLITFILNNYRCNSFISDRVPAGYKLVVCEDCMSLNNVVSMFNTNPEYDDILERIYNHGADGISNTAFHTAKENKIKENEKLITKIEHLLVLVSGVRLNTKEMFNLDYMKNYKKYLSNLAKLLNLKDKFKYNILLINYAARLFDESGVETETYNNLSRKIMESYRNMLIDSDKIENERDRASVRDIIEKKPVFKWWFEEERTAFAS